MAIELALNETAYGVPFPSAYHRIAVAFVERQRGGDVKFRAHLEVHVYAANPGGLETKELLTRRYSTPLEQVEAHSGPSFLEKCYQWLMTQPDMAGSQAV